MPAKVIEPLKDKTKLIEELDGGKHKTVCLCFWHGIGDLVMFLPIFRELEAMYNPSPFINKGEMGSEKISFTIGLPKGLTHEEILPPDIPYILLTAEEVNDHPDQLPFDLFAKITFPMSEGQTELTKAEYCCIHEIGIEPVCGHENIRCCQNRLVAVHFQITSLPDSCNPDEATAEKIWNEILDAGWIPLECHFQHIFHNPVNKKFPFIDATVRRCKARVGTLAGLLQNVGAFIGVVSGPYHIALGSMLYQRVMLLEKDFKKECFTKQNHPVADLKNYKDGTVKKFLLGLERKP